MEAAKSIELNLASRITIEETVKKERNRLFNFIKRYVSNPDDAEDILQDVFYRLTTGIEEINSLDKITSWLYTVTRNRITDLFRKKKATPSSELSYQDDEGEKLLLEEILPDTGNTPEDDYMRMAIMDRIMDALDNLPEEQSEAFIMNEIEGLSFREMSESTGVPINTLISRKRYAVIYLKEELRDLFNELS